MTVEKPKPKQLLRPITTGADSAMNQSQFLAITCNSLKAREKSRVQGAIAFGFASHWLQNWRESFKPITKRTKRSNRNHEMIFDSHLKTAPLWLFLSLFACSERNQYFYAFEQYHSHSPHTSNRRWVRLSASYVHNNIIIRSTFWPRCCEVNY